MTVSENMCVSVNCSHNCFQYASVPLDGHMNKNALTIVTNLSIVPLKSLLTVLALSVPRLILSIAKFINESK